MVLLFLCGVSCVLAIAEGQLQNLTGRSSLDVQSATHNLTEPVASDNLAGRKTQAQNVTDVPKIVNVSSAKVLNEPVVHNVSQQKRTLLNRFRNLTGRVPPPNVTEHAARNESTLNTTQGRKLQVKPIAAEKPDEPKKMSVLKDYQTDVAKNSSIYDNTDKFWQDVKKWALDVNMLECKEIMQKWFDTTSSVEVSGLPTSFGMIGNSSAFCKTLKQAITPKSVLWEIAFFNDLTSNAMGSFWVSGQAVDKSVKLPDQMEFVYNIRFEPASDKIMQLEIVPVEPKMIYEAVASKPIKSYHKLLRTASQEGLASPKFLALLSDKFVLETPNLFLGDSESKTRFGKSDLREFMEQDINVFDFENSKISSFSIPFHDERSVVSEIRFDELPIKSNGLELEGMKFWLTHIFDCKDMSKDNSSTVVPVTSPAAVPVVTSPAADMSKQNEIAPEVEDHCLMDKLIITVNHPVSFLVRLAPIETDLKDKDSSSIDRSSETLEKDV